VNDADRRALIARYEERLARHGRRPEALGWSRPALQVRRFAALSDPIVAAPTASVLDIGCGFADLYDFLMSRGWRGRYAGVELVPGLVAEARASHPTVEIHALDFPQSSVSLGQFDFVVASGIFNGRLAYEDHERYVEDTLAAMFAHCRIAACADFLSTFANYQKPENWHADPGVLLRCGRKLSRRLQLRHDYLPFECALYIFRQDGFTAESTFAD
jgi:SAM-dependent methyltransferase